MAAAALLLAGLTGCGNNSNGISLQVPSSAPSPPPTTATTPSASAGDAEAEVKARYTKFYRALETIANGQPPAERRQTMSKVAVDPVLSIALANVERLDKAGLVGYGSASIESVSVRIIAEGRATVRMCGDGSTSGAKDKLSGQPRTVGTKGAVATATMVKGSDGIWKASTFAEKPDETC